jgi:DNA-binding LytR/AlgR family response regulator
LTGLVRKWAAPRDGAVSILEYESAESFLFAREDEKPADILFLDIQMKKMDGVALAKKLRADGGAMQIVFITGYPDHIAEGYDVSALHYLLKPVREDKPFEVLDRAVSKIGAEEPALFAGSEGAVIRIFQKDILYIEAFWPVVKIVTVTDSFEVKANISEMEGQLDPAAFVRCHRSYIAGLRHVKRLTRAGLILDGDTEIPLSRRLYHAAHQAFFSFYKRVP